MFKKGFSLIEAVLLIFIISLIMGITISSLFCYQKTILIRLQQEKIAADVSLAKDYAKTKSSNVNIIFYYNTYTIKTNNKIIKNVYLDKDFNVSPQHLGFTAAGTPSFAGTVYLYNKNILISKYTVAVASGLMRWQNLP